MKRYLLIAIAMLGSLMAFAGSDLKVTSGNAKELKQGGAVYVTFDFEGATYDGKMPLTSHYANLDAIKEQCPTQFAAEFNEEAKSAYCVNEKDKAKYEVIIKVTNMDSYHNGGWGWGVPGYVTKMWGTITILDSATGSQVCTLNIKEIDGGGNPMPDQSFYDCVRELGEQTAKVFNKGK